PGQGLRENPLGCILMHWKDIIRSGGTENKKTLIKYCNQWWPLCKLENEAQWPLNGTLDYNTLLQLMLFLRREGKWDEVSYADMFFTIHNHPDWQKDCGLIIPQDPLVLTLDVGQKCTKIGKVHQGSDPNLTDLFEPPPRKQSPPQPQKQEQDSDSDPTPTPSPPGSPVSSRTQGKPAQTILQAPLREAVGPDGGAMLIKIPFSSTDLENWERAVKEFWSDPISVTRQFQFILKQHNPDWNDIQLLLDYLTETEKQLVLKAAGDLASDYCRTTGNEVKDFFPLQDPRWNPNSSAQMDRLKGYQDLILKGLERAMPKNINWSALYAIKQGPSESPSEFLDRLREVMRRNTPLDPGSEAGIQQLVSLFLGQSTGDIRRKLQKLCTTESRNLEVLLDEAWRVFSNREDEYRKGQQRVVAVIDELQGRKFKKGFLDKDQCSFCKERGHWKAACPKQKRKGKVLASIDTD
uniref:Core shell protein Gag P30 domain-containing protein n=1 Tax=Strix occidentalis caurina TaxID=311401 RepID=A0A8D0KWC1_STROC